MVVDAVREIASDRIIKTHTAQRMTWIICVGKICSPGHLLNTGHLPLWPAQARIQKMMAKAQWDPRGDWICRLDPGCSSLSNSLNSYRESGSSSKTASEPFCWQGQGVIFFSSSCSATDPVDHPHFYRLHF